MTVSISDIANIGDGVAGENDEIGAFARLDGAGLLSRCIMRAGTKVAA